MIHDIFRRSSDDIDTNEIEAALRDLSQSKTINITPNPETVAQIKPNITPQEVVNEVTNER